MTAEEQFIHGFNVLSRMIKANNERKGFWPGGPEARNKGEAIALVHSEVSEALEAIRHGNPPDDKVPEFSGAEAEFADVLIRVMDLAAGFGWRVAEAVVAKMRFNETREHKHGKAF